MATIPFSVGAARIDLPARIPPSERLARLKSRLERLLEGTAYLVRFGGEEALLHYGGFDGRYSRQELPVLEVYRLNYGLLAPLFKPDTVVATLTPMYEQCVESGIMRVKCHSAEGTPVGNALVFVGAAVGAGYHLLNIYAEATHQP